MNPAVAVANKFIQEAKLALDAETADLTYCIENHVSLPDNYWHRRHLADLKVQMALAVMQALEGET